MVILVGMGEKLAEQFLPLYLIAMGGGFISVGLLNGLDNFISAFYSFGGGYLSDRLGTKRALLLFNLMAMSGFIIVILIPTWQAVIVGAIFFLAWTAISLPATMSLVAQVLPTHKRTMGVTMHSMIRRIPMALGPVVGGVLIESWGLEKGVRIAFGVALLMAVVAIVLQERLIQDDRPTDRRTIRAEKNPLKLLKEMQPALKILLIADILIRFCEQIPYAFVVIWCVQNVHMTWTDFGILRAVEMVTAMAIYVPVAYLADRGSKKPYVVMTFVFFTLFPLVLMYCHSFVWLLGAFILRGLKEFGEPTRKALIMDLAPEGKKAGMFGAYYLVRDVLVSLAAFGGAFLWMIDPAVNLWTAFGCGVAGTLWFALIKSDYPSTSES